jgi:site-specific recombinase XerD
MNQSNLYHSFKRLIYEAGLPKIRFHDLRHSEASIMFNHGITLMVVAKRFGHSKVSVTLDTYSHLIHGLHDDIAHILDDLITPVEAELVLNYVANQ